MKKNDPRRNLIQTWCWGTGKVEMYVDPKRAPRWIKNKGLLGSPCFHCKSHIFPGCWYVRHPDIWDPICRRCSEEFGARPSPAMESA